VGSAVGSVTGSAVGSVVVVVVFETVVPEPPDALTDDVGPSPEVVVVCEPDSVPGAVVDDLGSVPVVVVVSLDPEVVAPEPVPLLGPASVFEEGSEDWSPVEADATPWPLATAIPSPTATANPLARFTRVARFACFPRLADMKHAPDSPEWRSHGTRKPGHEAVINSGET
jgi:hypothetical protein